MSEKLCLKWNDFQDNINTAFGSLRNEHEFSDVTLACEDGQQMEAHKVILATSSPFFKTLLRKNKHPHPLVYMRGVKSEDLVAILDFLYHGEANVYQEGIEAFLTIAEELEVKGLTGNVKNHEEVNFKPEPTKTSSTPQSSHPKIERHHPMKHGNETITAETISKLTDTTIELQNHSINVNISAIQELDEKVKSMMAKGKNFVSNGPNSSKNAHICTICGKEGRGRDIMDHIEANHLEGVSIPCDYCEKTFRSRSALRIHFKRSHK